MAHPTRMTVLPEQPTQIYAYKTPNGEHLAFALKIGGSWRLERGFHGVNGPIFNTLGALESSLDALPVPKRIGQPTHPTFGVYPLLGPGNIAAVTGYPDPVHVIDVVGFGRRDKGSRPDHVFATNTRTGEFVVFSMRCAEQLADTSRSRY